MDAAENVQWDLPTIRFPGQYYDAETGLHYNRFRYYDPSIGRYISADPIGQAGGVNVYGYAGNSPTNFVDPDGLFVISVPAAVVATVAAGGITAACVASGACEAAANALGDLLGAAGSIFANAANDDASQTCDDAVSGLEAGGVVDDSGNVRNVDKTGSGESATGAFSDLASKVGATPRKSKDGKTDVIDLPGGGTAAVRPNSKTGPPTVQVDRPGRPTTKVRFPRF